MTMKDPDGFLIEAEPVQLAFLVGATTVVVEDDTDQPEPQEREDDQ
jgi:hypothetical protein